ncbi:MAG TPA: hypothetical protein VKF35_04935 [Hyphomicrobiaceae bacterium]|nr:hypothetical protein [Hyphomicrobiaceae bacterium]
MREISLMAATAVITALITAWSMHPVGTDGAQKATVGSAPTVMQMMRNVRNLPEQSYDAY